MKDRPRVKVPLSSFPPRTITEDSGRSTCASVPVALISFSSSHAQTIRRCVAMTGSRVVRIRMEGLPGVACRRGGAKRDALGRRYVRRPFHKLSIERDAVVAPVVGSALWSPWRPNLRPASWTFTLMPGNYGT